MILELCHAHAPPPGDTTPGPRVYKQQPPSPSIRCTKFQLNPLSQSKDIAIMPRPCPTPRGHNLRAAGLETATTFPTHSTYTISAIWNRLGQSKDIAIMPRPCPTLGDTTTGHRVYSQQDPSTEIPSTKFQLNRLTQSKDITILPHPCPTPPGTQSPGRGYINR